jgi:hypothetical protein
MEVAAAQIATAPSVSPTAAAAQNGHQAHAASAASASAPAASASPAAPESPPAKPAARGRSAAKRPRGNDDQSMVPRSLLMMAVSYASAVTLALIYLLMTALNAKTHNLESLPDVVPSVNEDGKIMQQLVPENATMPPGHELKIGEAQRFGNLRVKPLRITRGPLHFVHYTGETKKKQPPPTRPVFKLWLQFENVSADQTFAPLGRELLLSRFPDADDLNRERANNFVCRRDDKSRTGHRVLVYNIPPEGDWDLKQQHVARALAPGESFETYIATDEEGLEALQGDLVWRVHLRKGYNPESRRGVTTLIEVSFGSDEVQAEPAT